MFPNSIATRNSNTPSWSETIVSSAYQLYGYLTSPGAYAPPRFDGGGNTKRPTARSVRRQQEKLVNKHARERDRQPETSTEPVLKAVGRVLSNWLPSLPGPMGVSGTSTTPSVLPSPDTTRFMRAVSEDFRIDDLGNGKALAGRPVIFLARDLQDPVERTMIGEAVRALSLDQDDILLVPLLSYAPNGDYTVDCYGLTSTTICNAFGVPQVLVDNHHIIDQYIAAMTEHMKWLEAQGELIDLEGRSITWAQGLERLHSGGEQLKSKNHHDDALHAEIDQRFSTLSKSARKVRALQMQNQVAVMLEARTAIKGSLKPAARLAVTVESSLGEGLLGELTALKPLLLEVKDDRLQQRQEAEQARMEAEQSQQRSARVEDVHDDL